MTAPLPTPPFGCLDLHRLSDYAIDPDDLHPLMKSLAEDLARQMTALNQALGQGADSKVLHPILHALKGMAGMFAMPAMHQSLTQADDACRDGHWATGEALARSVLPALEMWLSEVEGWLQRYSSGMRWPPNGPFR